MSQGTSQTNLNFKVKTTIVYIMYYFINLTFYNIALYDRLILYGI